MSTLLHSTTATFLPTQQKQRIDALDIIRGIALIGILLMNIEWFSRPLSDMQTWDPQLSGINHAAGWLIRTFVEGKFYTLFSILFGAGFAIMLTKAQQKNTNFTLFISRRLLILLAFGIIHMVFFWGGDILHSYAIAGLLLYVWFNFFQAPDQPANTYLKTALIWLFIPIFVLTLIGGIYGASFNMNELQEQPLLEQSVIDQDIDTENEITETEHEQEIFSSASYWQVTQYRASFALTMLSFSVPLSLFILMPLFLIGYWLIKSEKLINYQQHQSFYKILTALGLGLGIPLSVTSILLLQLPLYSENLLLQSISELLYYLSQYVLSAGYLGLLVLLLLNNRTQKWLKHFAPMGQMALTNYLMHSVILSLVFYGYAGGLYGEICRATQVLIALLIITIQIFTSKLWLSYFKFGPIEWLWRSLTYQQWQAFKLTSSTH